MYPTRPLRRNERCGAVWATEGGCDEDGFWDSEEDEHVCALERGHEDEGIYHYCAEHFACWPSAWAALPRSTDASA